MADGTKDSPLELSIPGIEEQASSELSQFIDVNLSEEALTPSEPSSETHPEKINEFQTIDELSRAAHATDIASKTHAPATAQFEIPTTTKDVIQKVRNFSENVGVGTPSVQAAFPFSLMILGKLTEQEKSKLIELLEREDMGIREVDLGPQLDGERILIPRISEFAGILLVQALRGTRAKILFGPSDTIFSTEQTRASEDELNYGKNKGSFGQIKDSNIQNDAWDDPVHPAESLPITPDHKLPEILEYAVIDTVTASASLKTTVVEAEKSSQYQEIVEALQREIKYKAFRKGADAIISYSITLTPLLLPQNYRLTAMGSAIKRLNPKL